MAALVTALVAGPSPVAATADEGTGRSSTGTAESPASAQGAPPAPMVDPAPNATARASEWIVLCTSFSPCKSAGYGNDGYDAVYGNSFWSQYGGHNCTNYVAYRMIRNGMSTTRPAGTQGYARDWGVGFASQTNDTPALGSVAWWNTSFSASGHVAYVERVVSSSEIYVSEDNWGGDFRWRKITRSGGRWPNGFIHLKDVTAPTAPPLSPAYRPSITTRILDTRTGLGAPAGAVGAGQEVSIPVSGRAGLPTAGVGAVVVNVSVVSPSTSGWLTTYPSGAARPTARNLSYSSGGWASSMTIAKVGTDGRIRMFTSAATQLTVDVLGWYPTGSNYTSITPKRVLDTRSGLGTTQGRLPAGGRVDLLVGGGGTVPSTGVGTVVLGVTADNPATSAWLAAWPAGSTRPVTTHVHVDGGRPSTSVVMTRIGSGGRVSIDTTGSTDVMVDVLGWFPTGSDYTSLTPARLLDTRTGLGGFSGAARAGTTIRLPVSGRGGVPSSGVRSVSVTLTSLSTTSSGALSIYPGRWIPPAVGNVLFPAGRTTVNAVVLPVGSDGTVAISTTTTSQIVLDVQGWVRS